jgi:hypothetical protein
MPGRLNELGLIAMHRDSPQTSDASIAADERAFVVFDTTTGEVLHIHHVVTFPGGRPRDDDRERALRLAGLKADPRYEILEASSAEVNRCYRSTKPRRPEPSKARECGTSEEV